ncbi:CheY-P phosphatase CheX [Halalkalibacter krulwichiae]|uniref:CheY-P phosphatase CheX n=3 Tax=Halalkalibacter krulwichiae TaxID=199441 RepID=A0A1X9M6S2_9BACI|nr:CheY-P phosphatase CheX [Halalkalibacter krulwichiae]
MGGMEINQIDELGWSAVQEFGNWIARTTATELSKLACIIDVTTPVVSEGESRLHCGNPFITVPLDSEIGTINVHTSIQYQCSFLCKSVFI